MALSVATLPSSSAVAKLPFASGSRNVSFGRRGASFRVRCQAEEKPSQPEPLSAPAEPTAAPSAAPVTPPPAKMSTKFSDVLAFSGPAPERINGRLAMVGFVSALGVELARGTGLAAQLAEGSGLPWFAATASVLTLASLVPLFKGVTAESRSGGLMSSDAEMWNGRFAMLGLVALAFTEFVTGSPLV